MIVSAIKLGQHLSTLQIIAVVLMFVAFILLNCQGVSLGGTKKGYWFMCAALALSNGTYGAFMSLQAGLLDGAERTEMIAVSYIGSALLAAAAAAILGLRVKRDRKNPDVKDAPPTLHISCGCRMGDRLLHRCDGCRQHIALSAFKNEHNGRQHR